MTPGNLESHQVILFPASIILHRIFRPGHRPGGNILFQGVQLLSIIDPDEPPIP